MPPALSSPTNLTVFIFLIVLWALVIVPRFVRLIRLLVRSSARPTRLGAIHGSTPFAGAWGGLSSSCHRADTLRGRCGSSW